MFTSLALPRRASSLRLAIGSLLVFVGLIAATPARAEVQATVAAYGELGRFPTVGGPATAEYGTVTTSNTLVGAFVDPLGMVVDAGDSSAPDGNAIYVLDNTNPQALQVTSATSVKLEYRIQKLGERGESLGSLAFSLQSTVSEPGLHAVSIAVDGLRNRVYVLIMDTVEGKSVVDRIDAWTAGRKSGEAPLATAVGLTEDKLVEDKATGTGELAGPAATHHLQTGNPGQIGDVEGESLTVAGTGADLALGGNEYAATGELSEAGTLPVIKLLKTLEDPGAVDGQPWRKAGETEGSSAKAWSQKSEELYSLSTDPDGSLNVVLGPISASSLSADRQPNMAEVSADLTATKAVLPWASAAEGATAFSPNADRVATDGFSQDTPFKESPLPSGATVEAGTLAPSVIQLGGETYAGLVAGKPIADGQNPSEALFSWHAALGIVGEGASQGRRSVAPSSLAIRVFDAQGASLAMIGNTTAGGPCNLQGGSSQYGGGFSTFSGHGSFVALARGQNGVLFALVQSELANTDESGPGVAPGSSVGAGTGNQVVEFAPGAGQNGAAGQVCPQPAGGFSITDETNKGEPSKGVGPVTVVTGTTLKFDASEVNLQGASPWAYDWNLADDASPGLLDHPWTVDNKFVATPGEAWRWPSPVSELKYDTPGSYTAKLNLVEDFGTLVAQRTVNVVKSEPITGAKIAVSGSLTAGQAVSLQASATLPAFDSVLAYHWDFGDGQGEDQAGAHSQTQHVYALAGTYSAKLTITDVLGQKAQGAEAIVIAPSSTGGGGGGGTGAGNSGGGGQTGPGSGGVVKSGPPIQTKPATVLVPPTRASQLAKALKVCKKIKPRRRRANCEKQAKKRYGPKAKKQKRKRRH